MLPLLPRPAPSLRLHLHGRPLLLTLVAWLLAAWPLRAAWDDLDLLLTLPAPVAALAPGPAAQPPGPTDEQDELVESSVKTVTVRAGQVPPSPAPLPPAPERPHPDVEFWLNQVALHFVGAILVLLGAAILATGYQARYAANFRQWLATSAPVAPVFALEAGRLRLLRPYPFAASALAGRAPVAAARLTEVDEQGKYVVLAGREKLFLPGVPPAAVLAWAAQHHLPRCRRLPVWPWLAAALGNPDAQAQHYDKLLAANIGPGEARAARQTLRVGWWLSLKALRGSHDDWGDAYTYDHQAILYMTGCALLPCRRWYWRTMALALRPPATPAATAS